jgi:hypothetical protein
MGFSFDSVMGLISQTLIVKYQFTDLPTDHRNLYDFLTRLTKRKLCIDDTVHWPLYVDTDAFLQQLSTCQCHRKA